MLREFCFVCALQIDTSDAGSWLTNCLLPAVALPSLGPPPAVTASVQLVRATSQMVATQLHNAVAHLSTPSLLKPPPPPPPPRVHTRAQRIVTGSAKRHAVAVAVAATVLLRQAVSVQPLQLQVEVEGAVTKASSAQAADELSRRLHV